MFEKLRGDFGGVTTDMLQAYHRSRDPLGGPYSVYMHRDDAETVSFSHVRVRADEIEFHYRSRFALGGKFHAGDRVHMHAR